MSDKQVLLSETVSRFLLDMDQAQKDYNWALQEESRMEKLTQDYLHMLEFGDLDYRRRAAVAKAIKECRVKRRESKDIINTTEPLVDFFNGERGKMLISQLQQVLGKIRKEEKFIEQRTYIPKVLGQEVFNEKRVYDGR